ncbi:MAG: hypothetical protein HC881_18615 [Leptolyngbyaceae cyanobacterium SL_7_1]|nr:hypothetical protein [Leptolyngbyaceae cyanobacterium SL_7_1]
MRFLGKLVGLVLVLAGIYFLGKNILFTTQVSPYWWRDISAAGSVLAVAAGATILVAGSNAIKEMGWLLVGVGILLIFVSGGVVLKPTSLWTFFVAIAALVAGFQLIRTGRIRF